MPKPYIKNIKSFLPVEAEITVNDLSTGFSSNIIPSLVERGLYCNHLVRPSVCSSVHTFVTDISASTGRNDFIFDIWLWHGYVVLRIPPLVHL
jgi:hypothetical protein